MKKLREGMEKIDGELGRRLAEQSKKKTLLQVKKEGNSFLSYFFRSDFEHCAGRWAEGDHERCGKNGDFECEKKQ